MYEMIKKLNVLKIDENLIQESLKKIEVNDPNVKIPKNFYTVEEIVKNDGEIFINRNVFYMVKSHLFKNHKNQNVKDSIISDRKIYYDAVSNGQRCFFVEETLRFSDIFDNTEPVQNQYLMDFNSGFITFLDDISLRNVSGISTMLDTFGKRKEITNG